MQLGYSQKKYSELPGGGKFPRVGFGTATIDVEATLEEAINVGYRHFDTAAGYKNEHVVGGVVNKAIREGKVKREELFITTKFNSDRDNVAKALNESLERLQLDYVDLFLIHWPISGWDKETQTFKQPPLHVTWKQLEDLVRAGKCKAIGVSNFNVQLLVDLLSYAEIKPACNQIEVHPYLIQEDLVGFCKKNGIEVTAYCPIARNMANPVTGIPLTEEPVIKEIAAKYNKLPSQVVLNWHLSRDYVVIPRTSNLSRLGENLECDTFDITPEETKKISALNLNHRICDAKKQERQGFTPVYA